MLVDPISFTLASALAFMPANYSVEKYQSQQTVTLNLATEEDFAHIASAILMANGTIEMFYRLAYADVRFFDSVPDLAKRFENTIKLLEETQQYRGKLAELDENLALFSKNFHKLHRLYESYEYKKEADRVLLSRVDSPNAVTILPNTSREEIKRLILG